MKLIQHSNIEEDASIQLANSNMARISKDVFYKALKNAIGKKNRQEHATELIKFEGLGMPLSRGATLMLAKLVSQMTWRLAQVAAGLAQLNGNEAVEMNFMCDASALLRSHPVTFNVTGIEWNLPTISPLDELIHNTVENTLEEQSDDNEE